MEKLNREQPEALHMALTGHNFFLTGSAGELMILGL